MSTNAVDRLNHAKPGLANEAANAAGAARQAVLAAIEPSAYIGGEGDEDFPDETKVVVTSGRTTHYALTLGDLRRARAAGQKGLPGKYREEVDRGQHAEDIVAASCK